MNKPLTSGKVDAERQTERVARVFAYGEDTHTLRLASELADLRVGYANPILARWARAVFEATVRCQKKKTDHEGRFFLLAAELGFEPRHTESESAVLPLHNSAINFDVDYFSI